MSVLSINQTYSVGHLTPNILLYEPSFEGWLSAVYQVYERKLQYDQSLQLIAEDQYVPSLISSAAHVTTDDEQAQRVLVKLNKLLGRSGMRQILWGFLSEKPNIGTTLFHIVKYAIDHPKRQVLEDLGRLEVLELAQTVKSVHREKHRMEAFVRFEHTTDDIYFARVEPDFNVLPIIGEHFRQRYQDQHWASDVFLSWAMSYFMVEAIDIYLDKKYEEKYNDSPRKKSSLDLSFSLTTVGVRYTF